MPSQPPSLPVPEPANDATRKKQIPFRYAESQWPLDLHSQRANILFCDGHVQALRRKDFVAQLNPITAAKPEIARRWNRDNKPHWP